MAIMFWNSNLIRASFSHSIPVKSGVSVYNLSKTASFHLCSIDLDITGCNLEVYSVEKNVIESICTTVCLDLKISQTNMVQA